MNLTISERKNETVFFLTAENMEEGNQIIRLANSQVSPNSGYANFGGRVTLGWVAIPKKKRAEFTARSGNRK